MSKKNPWISTKDAVPDNGRRVLIIWRSLETIGHYDNRWKKWTITGSSYDRYEVKYWRNMPKPPKEYKFICEEERYDDA